MKTRTLLCLFCAATLSVAMSNAYALRMTDPNVTVYDYILFPAPPGPGGKPIVWCFASTSAGQVIASLWQGEVSAFHSTELVWATNQINDVLRRTAAANTDRTRELSFIRFGGRDLLVWAKKGRPRAARRHALLRSTDSVSKIAKALHVDMQGYNGAQGTKRAFLELGGIMYCFEYPFPDCETTFLHDGSDMLWNSLEPTPSHPQELIDATKTITGILMRAATTNRDPNQHLCLISYNDRLFLTWSQHMHKHPQQGITRGSGKRSVYKALGLHP